MHLLADILTTAPAWVNHIIQPISRWLHIVATTLLVGGTLFFELVLPIAIADLRKEDQLYVFARARWVFRWVVWISTSILITTGILSLDRLWQTYHTPMVRGGFPQSLPWAIAHMALGAASIVIALSLTIGGRPPKHPIRWMRVNLVLLLVAVVLASTSRHVRLTIYENLGPPPYWMNLQHHPSGEQGHGILGGPQARSVDANGAIQSRD